MEVEREAARRRTEIDSLQRKLKSALAANSTLRADLSRAQDSVRDRTARARELALQLESEKKAERKPELRDGNPPTHPKTPKNPTSPHHGCVGGDLRDFRERGGLRNPRSRSRNRDEAELKLYCTACRAAASYSKAKFHSLRCSERPGHLKCSRRRLGNAGTRCEGRIKIGHLSWEAALDRAVAMPVPEPPPKESRPGKLQPRPPDPPPELRDCKKYRKRTLTRFVSAITTEVDDAEDVPIGLRLRDAKRSKGKGGAPNAPGGEMVFPAEPVLPGGGMIAPALFPSPEERSAVGDPAPRQGHQQKSREAPGAGPPTFQNFTDFDCASQFNLPAVLLVPPPPGSSP